MTFVVILWPPTCTQRHIRAHTHTHECTHNFTHRYTHTKQTTEKQNIKQKTFPSKGIRHALYVFNLLGSTYLWIPHRTNRAKIRQNKTQQNKMCTHPAPVLLERTSEVFVLHLVCAPLHEKVICLSLIPEALSSPLGWRPHTFQFLCPLPYLHGGTSSTRFPRILGAIFSSDIEQLKTYMAY